MLLYAVSMTIQLDPHGPPYPLYREHSQGLNSSKSYITKTVFLPFRLQILYAAYFAIFSFAQFIKTL